MYQMQNQNMAFNPNPSYAAYQYNPMQRFQQPEPQIPQMQPQFLGIQGKVVQSESAIMANDVPMDGSVAFFPMQDMSAIVAKQWDANGTIRKTVYKPFNEQMADSSSDDKRIEIGLSDDATKAITDKLDCLFGKMEELRKSAMYELKGDFMKKKILAIALGLTLCFGMTGCASWDRFVVDMKSDANGGMQRTITVYTADGKELATYKGKIDLSTNDGGYVKFDFNGKRYIYYNCFVESVADIK